MPETAINSAPDPNSVRLPWPIRVAAVLGVLVPVGMLTHLGHRDQQALGQEVSALSEEKAVLVGERDSLASEVAQFGSVREQLSEANTQLEAERGQREVIEREVAGLSKKVAVLGEREEALRGIIDVLEGEVASAERRLTKLAADRPNLVPELKHLTASAIVASNDPQLRLENDRLRNELRKHDDQVVELLGEISALNQEIEIIREQGGSFPQQQAAKKGAALQGSALAGLSTEE